MDDSLSVIDLFCGAGGFSNGFEQAGVEVLVGVDKNEQALETFEANHGADGFHHNIADGVPDTVRDLDPDGVIGSPPCKGFSDARGSRYLDDDRNGLVFEYIHWVAELQPKFAVMENVTGMQTISDGFMDAVEQEFKDSGYSRVTYAALDASEFGVPQMRERLILLAVRDDVDPDPSLPDGSYVVDPGQDTLGDDANTKITVREALDDLPEPTESGDVSLPPLDEYPDNDYLSLVRNGATRTTNHVAKEPPDDDVTRTIVSQLNPGEMYRSNRFGDRYRQVWELLDDRFSDVEQECLWFIGKHRSRKAYRMKGKSVGPVAVEDIAADLPFSESEIRDALESLHDDEWVRDYEDDGRVGYDLNTRSGIRPRHMRLMPDGLANTIMTNDFWPRNKMHPTEDRGLSLREGARLQSFPDDFEFYGTFSAVSNQVGNAVPPLLAKGVAGHIQHLFE